MYWVVVVGAGTFEERDYTAWAKGRLSELMQGTSFGSSPSCSCSISSVTVDKGHANTWFVRGKKRHGFDFEVSESLTVMHTECHVCTLDYHNFLALVTAIGCHAIPVCAVP